MGFNNPLINEKFYEDKPFLTAEKCVGKRMVNTIEYIKEHKAHTCVLTFCENLKDELLKISSNVVELDYLRAGEDTHLIYAIDNILFTIPFVGGPCAAATLEELRAVGVTKILACGSAGLIDNNFDIKKIFVVEEAIRDEGASYHYAKPEIKATTSTRISDIIKSVFEEKGINYESGITWTTDAFYRETEKLIELRKSQGCTAVEMECATWGIVAKSLGMEFGQFLYFSDAVTTNDWFRVDKGERKSIKQLMTKLSYDIALKM